MGSVRYANSLPIASEYAMLKSVAPTATMKSHSQLRYSAGSAGKGTRSMLVPSVR